MSLFLKDDVPVGHYPSHKMIILTLHNNDFRMMESIRFQ